MVEPQSPRILTQPSPDEGEQQCKQDVGPVCLMVTCYGDDAQEEEDEGFGDGGQHLYDVTNGGAGSLGHVLLHIVLHGDGAHNDAVGEVGDI